jgi:hypothetical protein
MQASYNEDWRHVAMLRVRVANKRAPDKPM